MLPNEARLILQALNNHSVRLEGARVLLNIGCQTLEFRESLQPWVGDLFKTLEAKSNLKVVHCDLFDNPGVDVVLDVLDPRLDSILKPYRGSIVMLSNLLENVENPFGVLKSLENWMRKGQILVLSGPTLFPWHPDPIDNMFRPNLTEISQILEPSWTVHEAGLAKDWFFWGYFRAPKKRLEGLVHLLGSIFKSVIRLDKRYLAGWLVPAKAFVVLAAKK